MMTTFTALAGSTVGAVADAVASDSPTPRLADEDFHAYHGYIDAIRLPHEPDPAPRRAALSTALDASAEVPLALTRLAAEIAEAGARLASSGNPHLRSDACTASYLSAAVAASAAVLVTANLRDRRGDARISEAARWAQAAAAAARRVGLPYDHLPDRDEES